MKEEPLTVENVTDWVLEQRLICASHPMGSSGRRKYLTYLPALELWEVASGTSTPQSSEYRGNSVHSAVRIFNEL